MRHHVSGSTHEDGKTGNLLNIDSSLVTSAHEDSSIEAHTPNIFFSNSSPIASIVTIVANALTVVGFSCSKQTIKRGITILASYSMAGRMAFPQPNKFSTTHKDLKCRSNIMAIILWACPPSKVLRNYKKKFITLITSSCIFICKTRISLSNES
jgi:hypothetical protein